MIQLSTPDLVYQWFEKTGKRAMLTICDHAVKQDISMTDLKAILIATGLVEEVEND
jgi:hypothetical protein